MLPPGGQCTGLAALTSRLHLDKQPLCVNVLPWQAVAAAPYSGGGSREALEVVRKGQAHQMSNTEFNGCPVGFMPAGQPLTVAEQQTLSAEPTLGSQGLLP